jgi:hypothetical protein
VLIIGAIMVFGIVTSTAQSFGPPIGAVGVQLPGSVQLVPFVPVQVYAAVVVTTTLVEAATVHPFALVAVTVYVPVIPAVEPDIVGFCKPEE